MKYVPQLEEESFQSMAAVPILSRAGDTIGVIVLHTRAPHEFGEETPNLLTHIASLVSGAIENAQLYDRERRRVDALTGLSELAQQVAAAPDAGELGEVLVRGTAALLDADACQLLRVGPDGEITDDRVEATIVETMRSRPVIPIIGRRVQVPWRLGDYAIEPGTAIAMSILLVHHREDVYPDPFAFRPERFLGRKPGTYDWIPFGGGIRRCLGAALAMAEQRVVLTTMARRLDLETATPAPERAMHRNVTMIPAQGATVVIAKKH